jgi:hypothetical protein
MKIARILLLALAAVPALAELSPVRGTTSGGDAVVISDLTCGACTPVTVTFGGIASPRIVSSGNNRVVAITPPHAAGAVTVVLSAGATQNVGTFTYVASGTIIDDNYERALIPLSLGGGQFPGAYGSVWASELWIHNSNSFATEVLFGNPDCAPNCSLTRPVVNPGETRDARYMAATGVPFGLIAWVQKGGEEGLTFSLQVRDISRARLHSGTEMPVVYESKFRDSLTLLNVPLEPASSRTAVRVFNLDASNQLPVRILITPAATNEVLVDDTLNLRQAGVGGLVPAFARYTSVDDLVARYPQLNGISAVRITLSTPDATRIWAFAAVTNNETQLITTVVPH